MSKDSFDNWRDDVWHRYGAILDREAPFRSGIATLPDGWQKLVEATLARIETILRADRLGRLVITNLSHRLGMLSIGYALSGFRLREIVEDVVDLAKARASSTCDICGAAGVRYLALRDVDVRCDTHRIPGSGEIKPPWPLIRVEREIVAGVSRIKRCRIYDRDRDAFVEVDPESLGIPRSP